MGAAARRAVETSGRSSLYRQRIGRWAASWGGPMLIIFAVVVVLHDFAFRGLAPSQRGDVLAFWLPNHCFLGRSLAGGDLPGWNPYVMGGVPFAADPQSGWLYAPAMLLYTALPCEAALPAFIVLQPLLAGLGMWWFLRSEALSRTASAVGGLALALPMASSAIAVSLPVAGSLAWSAVLLATASRYAHATTWSTRLLWVTAGALAWGQLAAAHLSHGLIMGTGAVLLYLVGRSISDVRAGRRSIGQAVAIAALFVAVLLPVNVGALAPRLSYLSRSSLALGYEGMQEEAGRTGGIELRALNPKATGGLAWPLRFATSPGAYLGASALALSLVALASRRYRPLVASMAGFGVISYLLPLPAVARTLAPALRDVPFGDVYLHAPGRFRYGLLIVMPILAAVGADAWRARGALGGRLWMAILAAAVWAVVPLVIGIDPSYLALLAGGAVLGGIALLTARARPGLVSFLPLLLAVELCVGGLIGQAADREVATGPPGWEPLWNTPFGNLRQPDVDLTSYLAEGPIARALETADGRYLSISAEGRGRTGYAGRWREKEAGLMDSQRAILLGVEDAQGYNPVQSLRYWRFGRRLNRRPPRYNVTTFHDPGPAVLDLLQVTSIVAPSGAPPRPGFTPVVSEGPWTLYRGPPRSRASLAFSWSVASSSEALDIVASSSFDPSRQALVEGQSRPARDGLARGPAWARYRPLGSDRSRVTVSAPRPAVLVVRNVFDPNWEAAVDGRPVDVLPAQYLVQGIPVPAGRHVVDLRYEDPTIILGLLGSIVGVGALLLAATGARLRERSGRRADG